MNYKICVYIPGINYTSSGPGFIDAIKLEAIDTQNRNKTYKVKSVFTDNSSKDESVIFRTTVELNKKYESTRSSYGYFYDYVVSQTEKKEFNHTLTCFPDIEELQNLKSFDQNTKDGIFYVEIDKEDALVELNFTFYTLSYDQYTQDDDGNDIIEKSSVNGSLDNFIVIGKLKNIIRASNLITDEAAEIVGDEALSMYYDITRETKDSDKLYLPVGEDFVPIRGLDGERPEQLKMGDDIFTDYTPDSINWGKPKEFEVPVNKDETEVIAEDIAYCGYAVMTGTLPSDNFGSSEKDWFSPPTPVHIAKRSTKSNEFNITLSTSSYKFDNINVLWKNPINIVVQNATYMEKFQEDMNESKYFSPISILEFVPELKSIDIKEDAIKIFVGSNIGSTNKTQVEGNASALGRVFSNALDNMSYTQYSIMSYINNFGKTGKTEGPVFIYRPDYMKNDISEDSMFLKKDPSVMINADTMSSILHLEEYSINPDSDLYNLQIWKPDEQIDIYPLNKYINSQSLDSEPAKICPTKTLEVSKFDGSDPSKTADVHYCIEEQLNYYQHVFTLEDLKNVSTIFGENKIYLTDPTLSMKLNVQTSYPIMQFYQRWDDGPITTNTDSEYFTKSPAIVYWPINYLHQMINWSREQCSENELITNIATEGSPSFDLAYQQKLIISPMLAIDMDKSNTVITNKGDYKVIPAYYYGDCQGSSNKVLTDYKKQKCNIDLTSGQFVEFNKDAQKVAVNIPEGMDPISEESNYKHAICSTFQTPDVYLLSNKYFFQKYYIQDLQLSNSKLTPGIYVIKFHKYLENNDIKLNGVKIEYSIKFGETQLCSNCTTEKDFIALYVSKEIEDGVQLSITVKNPENSKIIIGNFALYKVDIDDQNSLNSMVLKTWCSTYQTDKDVICIQEDVTEVYNNIIFPSAICVYEKFSLLQKPVYHDDDNKYRKDYLSLYLPNKATKGGNAASIYSIIGMYNIQDVKITQLKELPDDMLEDEKNKIINKIIRYV